MYLCSQGKAKDNSAGNCKGQGDFVISREIGEGRRRLDGGDVCLWALSHVNMIVLVGLCF